MSKMATTTPRPSQLGCSCRQAPDPNVAAPCWQHGAAAQRAMQPPGAGWCASWGESQYAYKQSKASPPHLEESGGLDLLLRHCGRGMGGRSGWAHPSPAAAAAAAAWGTAGGRRRHDESRAARGLRVPVRTALRCAALTGAPKQIVNHGPVQLLRQIGRHGGGGLGCSRLGVGAGSSAGAVRGPAGGGGGGGGGGGVGQGSGRVASRSQWRLLPVLFSGPSARHKRAGLCSKTQRPIADRWDLSVARDAMQIAVDRWLRSRGPPPPLVDVQHCAWLQQPRLAPAICMQEEPGRRRRSTTSKSPCRLLWEAPPTALPPLPPPLPLDARRRHESCVGRAMLSIVVDLCACRFGWHLAMLLGRAARRSGTSRSLDSRAALSLPFFEQGPGTASAWHT